jgi:hypothetical protein
LGRSLEEVAAALHELSPRLESLFSDRSEAALKRAEHNRIVGYRTSETPR